MARLTPFAFAAIAALSPASYARGDVAVHDPATVRDRWIVTEGNDLVLSVDARSWTLVTDPAAKELSKLGDGAFHPMDPRVVREALEAMRWSPADLPSARILVLPFPRSGHLKSSCEEATIFLSPGLRDVLREHAHATVVHEVGHLVQQLLAPDGSGEWARYVVLRGLRADRYHAGAAHRDRPHEIFAEDFRMLYGGAVAATSGAHENADLAPASDSPAVVAWFEDLRRSSSLATRGGPQPQGYPNPFSTSRASADFEVRFQGARDSRGAGVADVLDVTGRAVARLDGLPGEPGTVVFRWNGRDAGGAPAASGVYLVRWRGHPGAGTARVHVLH
jgi:hypothetical protein